MAQLIAAEQQIVRYFAGGNDKPLQRSSSQESQGELERILSVLYRFCTMLSTAHSENAAIIQKERDIERRRATQAKWKAAREEALRNPQKRDTDEAHASHSTAAALARTLRGRRRTLLKEHEEDGDASEDDGSDDPFE